MFQLIFIDLLRKKSKTETETEGEATKVIESELKISIRCVRVIFMMERNLIGKKKFQF